MLNLKGNQMTEFESKCYGMSQADIREEYMNGITARISGLEMVVMSILSDAQELQAMGRNEAVRKQLNVAKFILSEMMEGK
jgi:C4-dicarboxylate transporter